MWEEDPRYQQASFRPVVGTVVFVTLLLAFVSWLSDDFAPLRNWLVWLLLVEGAWLLLAALIYGMVRLWFVWRGRRARNRAGLSSSG